MNDMMKSLRDTKVEKSDLRVMVIGAHPDDADNLAGGTAIKFARAGARVAGQTQTGILIPLVVPSQTTRGSATLPMRSQQVATLPRGVVG